MRLLRVTIVGLLLLLLLLLLYDNRYETPSTRSERFTPRAA